MIDFKLFGGLDFKPDSQTLVIVKSIWQLKSGGKKVMALQDGGIWYLGKT